MIMSAEFYQELLLILFILTCIPAGEFCTKPWKAYLQSIKLSFGLYIKIAREIISFCKSAISYLN